MMGVYTGRFSCFEAGFHGWLWVPQSFEPSQYVCTQHSIAMKKPFLYHSLHRFSTCAVMPVVSYGTLLISAPYLELSTIPEPHTCCRNNTSTCVTQFSVVKVENCNHLSSNLCSIALHELNHNLSFAVIPCTEA